MAPKDRRLLVMLRPDEDVDDDALVEELAEAMGIEVDEDEDREDRGDE